MGLLGLCHDSIVMRFLRKAEEHKSSAFSSDDWLSVALTALRNAELFIEIASRQQWETKGRWISIFVVECIK